MKKLMIISLSVSLFFSILGKSYGEPLVKKNLEENLPGLLKSEVDSDFDGKIDQWAYYDENGTIARAEFDTNKDGKVNHWEFYGKKGILERVELDSDFNGQIDQWIFFDKSGQNKTSSKFDTNGDNLPNQWEYYGKNGDVNRVEIDTNSDGKPDQWGYYEDNKLVKNEFDSNHDGKVDRREYYK